MDPFEIGKQLGELIGEVKALNVKADKFDERLGGIETTLSKTVQPQLATLMTFRGQVGKVTVTAGAIAMSAAGLVWHGLAQYGSDILNLVLGLAQGRRVS
jgi:hypothetical protein